MEEKYRNYDYISKWSELQISSKWSFIDKSVDLCAKWWFFLWFTKILTGRGIVKWPLLFTRHPAASSVFTFLCKKTCRIVWDRFRSYGRIRWHYKVDFLEISLQKVIFDTWQVIKKNFRWDFLKEGSKIPRNIIS